MSNSLSKSAIKSAAAMRTGSHFLISLVLIFGTACSSLSSVAVGQLAGQQPTVEFAGLSIKDVSMQSITLDVALEVDNPNSFGVNVENYNYKLDFGGDEALSGNSQQGFAIKANGKQTVTLPIVTTFAEINRLLSTVKNKSSVDYRVTVAMNVALPVFGSVPYKVNKEGSIQVPQLPQVGLKTMRVKNIDMTSGEFEVIVSLYNPNKFALRFNDFNYQLSVKGEDWAKGNMADAVNIASLGQQYIAVPIQLSLFNIGSALQEVLQTGTVSSYKLSGSVNIDSDLPYLKNFNMPFETSSQ